MKEAWGKGGRDDRGGCGGMDPIGKQGREG